MEGQKNKIEGWRKLGIGISGITALYLSKGTIDFKVAVIIGIISIVGIITQGILDYAKRKIPKVN